MDQGKDKHTSRQALRTPSMFSRFPSNYCQVVNSGALIQEKLPANAVLTELAPWRAHLQRSGLVCRRDIETSTQEVGCQRFVKVGVGGGPLNVSLPVVQGAHPGSQHSHLPLAGVIDTLKCRATFDHLTGGRVTTPDCTFQPVIGCESAVTPEIFSLIP